MEITFESDYDIGDIVYFKFPNEYSKGVVTGILIRYPKSVTYEVTWNDKSVSVHTLFELTDTDQNLFGS